MKAGLSGYKDIRTPGHQVHMKKFSSCSCENPKFEALIRLRRTKQYLNFNVPNYKPAGNWDLFRISGLEFRISRDKEDYGAYCRC